MEKEKLFEVIQLLLKKYVKENGEIQFDSKFIESILFTINPDGTKTINKEIFGMLCSNSIDMNGVSFDNVYISGYYFGGLKNVEINIQKIPNFDISRTELEGVKLIGTLDGANIRETKFKGYIGELTLDPQKVKNKDLYFTDLAGIKINGSFDNVMISMTRFKNAIGEIKINPQKVQDKDLSYTEFSGVELVGTYHEETNTYDAPCFDDCKLWATDFTDHIGNAVINPQTIKNKSISMCNVCGVTFNGSFDGVSIYATRFKGSKGAKINLNNVKCYSDHTDLRDVEILNQNEKMVKKRGLSPNIKR